MNFLRQKNIPLKFIIKIKDLIFIKKRTLKFQKNLFLFDDLGINKKLMYNLKLLSKYNKIISLEDLKNFRISDLTINSKMCTKKFFNKKISKKYNIFQGSKYMILRNEYFSNRKKRFLLKKKNYKLLLSTGGGDLRSLSYKVANYFRDEKKFQLSILIGPGVRTSNPIFNYQKKRPKKINLVRNNFHIKKLMLKNDIVLCTGGTTMFETMAVGKPLLSIESFLHQRSIIEFYDKKKCLNSIGSYKKITKNKLFKKLNEIVKNPKKTNYKLSNAYNCFDGLGLKRVINQINKIIYKL